MSDLLTAAEFSEGIEEVAEHYPGSVRRFIEAHPLHLMAALGAATEPFHVKAVNQAISSRQLLWLMARGFGKTQVLSIFFPTWLSVAHPDKWDRSIDSVAFFEGAPERVTPQNIRIALVSSTRDRAAQSLFAIKQVLQHPVMQRTFGSLVGAHRWRENSADTALRRSDRKEPTFECLGIDSGIAGGHHELVVLDDIFTDKNQRTERGREATLTTWQSTVQPTIRPYGRVILLGTRWHPKDLASTILEQHRSGNWGSVIVQPAVVERSDGSKESIWPGLWPMKKLDERRREMGDRPFRAQFLMDASALGGGMFEDEWLERFGEIAKQDLAKAQISIGIDPATSLGERADKTGIVVVAKVPPFYYVLEAQAGKWTYSETIARTKLLAKRYWSQLKWILVEDVGGHAGLVQQFRREARDLPVRGANPKRLPGPDKAGRMMFWLAPIEQGRLFFARPTPENGIEQLLDQLRGFPLDKGAGVDDLVDALAYALFGTEFSKGRAVKANIWGRGRR
jgi:hypothetical protein